MMRLLTALSWFFVALTFGMVWRSERAKKKLAHAPREPDLFDRLLEVDAKLVAAGYPALTDFWRDRFERFLRSSKRWLVGRIGRRGGKGVTSCKVAIVFALFAPIANVAPGEHVYVQFLSVDRDEAANRLRMIEAMLTVLGETYTRRGDEIDLQRRPVSFRVTTASIRGTVGRTTLLAVCDEGARWRDETGANPAREILASLAPSMATQPDARGLFLSAPWTEHDHHAQRYEEGDSDRQMVCLAASWVANSTLTKESTQRDEPDPRTWSREYAAVPVAGVTSICDAVHLASPTSKATRRASLGVGCHAVTLDAGFDFDAFAASAWHREYREGPNGEIRDTLVQDGILHLKPTLLSKVKLEKAVDALTRFAKDFGVTKVFGDAHFRAALEPMLAERGITLCVLPMTSPLITQRVMSFQARLAADEGIELLTQEEQKREILQAHLIHHSGGRVTLKAPENQRNKHDDILSTILLAHDAEVISRLPPSEGELIVTQDDLIIDRETGSEMSVSGGRYRYWKRAPGGKLIEREPPMLSLEFEIYAEEMLAKGESTPAIERWLAWKQEQAMSAHDDIGISVPIVNDD